MHDTDSYQRTDGGIRVVGYALQRCMEFEAVTVALYIKCTAGQFTYTWASFT